MENAILSILKPYNRLPLGGLNALSNLGLTPQQGGLNVPLYFPPSSQPKWVAVRQRFEQFHRNLALTPPQRQDGIIKRNGIVNCLNRHYYGSISDTEHSFFVGSWSKDTATRPPRDIDLFFLLPNEVYNRFQRYLYGRQSALLQEVKGVLSVTYPDTDMSGDGQVILVNFGTYSMEVVPAFCLTNGRYWICNTNAGGSYKESDPWAEVSFIEAVDQVNNHNLRPLIRMLKAWQANCSVPIKSFQLELLAADFIGKSLWRFKDFFWFDWITRDFFAYLYYRANTVVVVPGTGEIIPLGNDWQSRAETAYNRAQKACSYEEFNLIEAAGEEWQKIFGQQVPRIV